MVANPSVSIQRSLYKKLDKARRKGIADGNAFAKFIAEKIKGYARQKAPQDTQALIRNIKVFRGEGTVAYVVASLNPKSNRSGGTSYFNLPRWMHETGGNTTYKPIRTRDGRYFMKETGRAHQHFKTGNPRYMWVARDYAKKNKRTWANQFINKGKKR